MQTNALYFGDNLNVLSERLPDGTFVFPSESVDLVYLDPPFNSNRDYSVIFKEAGGEGSDAQIKAFTDSWHWGPLARDSLEDLTVSGVNAGRVPEDVGRLVDALVRGIGHNDMSAYLVMMAPRLLQMHRVLKRTGSLWLHCDPTASHYLKIVLDAIFVPKMFRNEVIWQRTGAHNDARRFGRVTDSLLYYTKTNRYTFHPQYAKYEREYVEERYHYRDPDGRRFWPNTATSPNPRPNMMYEWKGRPSPRNGWRFERATMERLEGEGRLYYSKSGMVYVKNYLDEQKGRPAQNLWTDIVMSKSGAERLGYPTQKPLALLERIVQASSNEGDIVLDPFCGCGTATIAAQKLKRKWVGIDITHLSIAVMRSRLFDSFGLADVPVHGVPADLQSARLLAAESKDGRYEFQWWHCP